MVVGDVAEERRPEIHVPDAGEDVLGELGEIEHGELAVFLAEGGGLGVDRAGGGAALEERAHGPRVGGDAGELFLFVQRAGDAGAALGGGEGSGAEGGGGGLEKGSAAGGRVVLGGHDDLPLMLQLRGAWKLAERERFESADIC